MTIMLQNIIWDIIGANMRVADAMAPKAMWSATSMLTYASWHQVAHIRVRIIAFVFISIYSAKIVLITFIVIQI